MKRLLTLGIVAAFLYPLAVNAVIHSTANDYTKKGVTLSLRDPIGSVYREGEEVGFSIRTDTDAYVIVFEIDTDGFVHLLYPVDGKNIQRFSSGRVYNLPGDPSESFVVGGAKGLEFVFALAVEDLEAINDDEVHFLARNESLPVDRMLRITGDPLLGANRIVSQLVRGVSLRRDVTISFTYFYVGEAVDFPRYLCEDCYKKGKDPYAEGMPTFVANTDFEKTNGLTYPLAGGFVGEYAEVSAPVETEKQTSVTRVYVSYYPRWDDGFYNISWWYLDPWYWNVGYWDPWYTPYWGVYFGAGWNWGWWGWGACHYRYFPYYYSGPYYAYRPWRGYYNCYPDYYGSWYQPRHPERWRSYGVVQKGQGHRTSTLHTAMNRRVNRDLGLGQRSAKPFGPWDRRVAAKPHVIERSSRSLEYRRTAGGADPQIIRNRPIRFEKDTRATRSRESREVRPGKGFDREQRVITRPSKGTKSFSGEVKRTVNTREIERRRGEFDRRLGEPRKPQTGVAPNATRQKPESRGVYKPNVRRESGGKNPPARDTGASSRRSSSSSKATSSSKTTSSSKGGSRQKR